MPYQPTLNTVVFVSLFLGAYVGFLIKKTVEDALDLYDFLLLSTVAIIPSVFVYFPGSVVAMTRLVGVAFPFLLLFGSLFVIVFVYLHRLVVKMKRHDNRNVVLIQELSLLRLELERLGKDRTIERESL